MKTLRVIATAALAVGMVVTLAGGVSAAAASAVCDKISLEEADLGGLGGKKFVAASFAKAAKAFKTGSKAAPAKIKRAMLTMSAYYKQIAGADSATDAIGSLSPNATEKFSKASVVWGTYIATNCS
jgi:hypothetical protein